MAEEGPRTGTETKAEEEETQGMPDSHSQMLVHLDEVPRVSSRVETIDQAKEIRDKDARAKFQPSSDTAAEDTIQADK